MVLYDYDPRRPLVSNRRSESRPGLEDDVWSTLVMPLDRDAKRVVPSEL